jgi:hypothetical protein
MGWARGGEIFDPMARVLLACVEAGTLSEKEVTKILGELAGNLFAGDWDTYDESLEEFNRHPIILEAFRLGGHDLTSGADDD